VQNTSDNEILLWVEAKEKIDNFKLQPHGSKDIGWAQVFRFDANDAVFLWSEGYDTLRLMMPGNELSPWRLRFAKEGGLLLSLSQSFIQDRVQKEIKPPIEQSYSNIVRASVTEVPQIILRDGSNRIYAEVPITTYWFNTSMKVIVKTRVSFVPEYQQSDGKFFATNLQLDDVNIDLVPQQWLSDLKSLINQLLIRIFKPVEIFQLDKSLLKYARFFNVRGVIVHDGRLEVHFL